MEMNGDNYVMLMGFDNHLMMMNGIGNDCIDDYEWRQSCVSKQGYELSQGVHIK